MADAATQEPHKVIGIVWIGDKLEIMLQSPTNRVYRGMVEQWQEVTPVAIAAAPAAAPAETPTG